MGIESFLLASSLIGVLSQRLIRVLCQECKEGYTPTDTERERLGVHDGSELLIYRPRGCAACGHLGYRGRTGIFEMIAIDDTLRTLIHDGSGEQAMTAHVRTRFPGLHSDGLRRVLAGDTSLEEVLRVTQEE
jgi:general secretion pathway protein E